MAMIIPFVRPAMPASAPPAPARARILRFPTPARPPAVSAPAVDPAQPVSDAKIADQEKAMKAKIHIALRGRRGVPGLFSTLPGFTEDVYRFTLRERWGVDSSAKMSRHQLDEVLHWLSELGFMSNRPLYARRDYTRWGEAALIEKINALLAEKGQKETGTFLGMEYAEGILKRQTRGEAESVYRATPKQLRAVIAALDKDASRKGRRRG